MLPTKTPDEKTQFKYHILTRPSPKGLAIQPANIIRGKQYNSV